MAYKVTGLRQDDFASLFSLNDAEPGENLILLNHVSHDVATPYRSSYAIFVRENAQGG